MLLYLKQLEVASLSLSLSLSLHGQPNGSTENQAGVSERAAGVRMKRGVRRWRWKDLQGGMGEEEQWLVMCAEEEEEEEEEEGRGEEWDRNTRMRHSEWSRVDIGQRAPRISFNRGGGDRGRRHGGSVVDKSCEESPTSYANVTVSPAGEAPRHPAGAARLKTHRGRGGRGGGGGGDSPGLPVTETKKRCVSEALTRLL